MEIEQHLIDLSTMLAKEGYENESKFISTIINSSNEDRLKLLVSNRLWGGAGSVVDESFMNYKGSKQVRLHYIDLMLSLARYIDGLQVEKNVRQDKWVDFLKKWRHRIEFS